MLALKKVLEVQRLLDEGKLSRRAIARETGVGRSSVNAIANRERGLFGFDPDAVEDATGEPVRSTVAERCPECGGMVYAPCVLCEARRHLRVVGESARRAA